MKIAKVEEALTPAQHQIVRAMKFSCKKKTNQNIRKQGDIETSKLI
jgi:hypothetical protein